MPIGPSTVARYGASWSRNATQQSLGQLPLSPSHAPQPPRLNSQSSKLCSPRAPQPRVCKRWLPLPARPSLSRRRGRASGRSGWTKQRLSGQRRGTPWLPSGAGWRSSPGCDGGTNRVSWGSSSSGGRACGGRPRAGPRPKRRTPVWVSYILYICSSCLNSESSVLSTSANRWGCLISLCYPRLEHSPTPTPQSQATHVQSFASPSYQHEQQPS